MEYVVSFLFTLLISILKAEENVCECGKMKFEVPESKPFAERFSYEQARHHLTQDVMSLEVKSSSSSIMDNDYEIKNLNIPQPAHSSFSGFFAKKKKSLPPVKEDRSGMQERLVGGQGDKSRPWMALILQVDYHVMENGKRCGGTLINHWYVLTASHCVCPTAHRDRIDSGACDVPQDRIKIDEHFPYYLEICFGVENIEICEIEMKMGMAYRGTELVVHKERLVEDNPIFFDIALIKTERKVKFNSQVSPICLPAAIKFKKTYHKNAYISGYGVTHFVEEGKGFKAICTTNEFLPRPYHICSSSCFFSPPPQEKFEQDVCNWVMINNIEHIEKADVIKLIFPEKKEPIICYPNVNKNGWCYTNSSYSHDDFATMPNWGYCNRHCGSETDSEGNFVFQAKIGVAFWAKQTLLSYRECLHYIHGMTGKNDPEEGFDPGSELCAAQKHEPKMQEFVVHNLTFTNQTIQGNAVPHGLPKIVHPAYIGGIDTCQGDSGGPMWRWQITDSEEPEERVVQIGIIARGDKCASVNRPGIYTKIYSYRDWILENTKDGECDVFV